MSSLCAYCGDDICDDNDKEKDEKGLAFHTACKKFGGFINSHLKTRISHTDEEDFNIRTNDFSRPDLKQIGNSVCEVRRHFMSDGGLKVYPCRLESPLREIRDMLVHRLQDKSCTLYCEQTNTTANRSSSDEGVLVFIVESLPMAFNFPSRPRPHSVKCDVFIQLPNHPSIVLTVADGSDINVKMYNTSIHRRLTSCLLKFLDVSFKPVFGVLKQSELKNTSIFNDSILRIVQCSRTFVSTDALSMTLQKHNKVLTAFWAGIAETTSAIFKTETENKANTSGVLHFLTKDQCIILIENINCRYRPVHVTSLPGTGATTLMLEVAMRLSRVGNTLLLVKDAEEKQRLRTRYPDILTADDLERTDISKYVNIVDESNTSTLRKYQKQWTFTSGLGRDNSLVDGTDKGRNNQKHSVSSPAKDKHKIGDQAKSEEAKALLSAAIPHIIGQSQIADILAFEYGQAKEFDILRILRGSVSSDKQELEELYCQKSFLEEVVRGAIHTVGIHCKPKHVICAKMRLDKDNVNTEYCQLTSKEILANCPPENIAHNLKHLEVYLGTTGSISFPCSSSDPVLQVPRYWESHSRIWLNRVIRKWLTLLEIGVCEESQVDKGVWACNQERSWAIRLVGCNSHAPWICLQVYSEKRRVQCFPDVIGNTANSSVRVCFGVVLDIAGGRLGFIDLQRSVVLAKFDVKFKERLYSVFGVGPWRDEYTIETSLVTGRDISMTDSKKNLIYSALT